MQLVPHLCLGVVLGGGEQSPFGRFTAKPEGHGCPHFATHPLKCWDPVSNPCKSGRNPELSADETNRGALVKHGVKRTSRQYDTQGALLAADCTTQEAFIKYAQSAM